MAASETNLTGCVPRLCNTGCTSTPGSPDLPDAQFQREFLGREFHRRNRDRGLAIGRLLRVRLHAWPAPRWSNAGPCGRRRSPPSRKILTPSPSMPGPAIFIVRPLSVNFTAAVSGPSIEESQIPFFPPFDERLAGLVELDGQPDVAAVDGVFGTPAVGHEDEGVLFAMDWQDMGALAFESDLRAILRADARDCRRVPMGPR